MYKFGRNYVLQVGTPSGGTLTIELPFTIEFDITRNTLTSANVCSIRIYNLNAANRNQIRFNVMDTGIFQSVILQAGYGQNLSTVFTGNITQAWSVREGTNFITTLECFDGGYAFNNGQISTQFPAGTSEKIVLQTVASALPFVSLGSIGNYPDQNGVSTLGTLPRGNAVSGSTVQVLTQLTGTNGFFIDGGKVNCLGDNECTPGGTPLIDDSSGLLATPVRELTKMTFDMIFEPGLVAGQLVNLQSAEGTSKKANFNGVYKVTGVKHRGTISGAVCGDAITSVELFYGTQGPQKLVVVPR
jgi:hypothetical protein